MPCSQHCFRGEMTQTKNILCTKSKILSQNSPCDVVPSSRTGTTCFHGWRKMQRQFMGLRVPNRSKKHHYPKPQLPHTATPPHCNSPTPRLPHTATQENETFTIFFQKRKLPLLDRMNEDSWRQFFIHSLGAEIFKKTLKYWEKTDFAKSLWNKGFTHVSQLLIELSKSPSRSPKVITC